MDKLIDVAPDMYSDGARVMGSVASFLGLCEDWNWDSYVHAIHNRRSSPYPTMTYSAIEEREGEEEGATDAEERT